MKQLTLIINNRILLLCDLDELSISYYPKYGLYALYYCDANASRGLICSLESFCVLLMIEKKIMKAYNDNMNILRI